MKKHFLYFLFLFSTPFAFSQTAEPETSPCPNPKKLRGLCGMVESRMKDKINNDHLYKTRYLEASCLEAHETEEARNKKIKETWEAMEDEFVCDSSQFDVVKGNILKFAVSNKFEDFIRDAIEWQVNLNRVDPSDNRTVLDYVSFHMERHKGNSLGDIFKHYYTLLSEAGAKHKSEL